MLTVVSSAACRGEATSTGVVEFSSPSHVSFSCRKWYTSGHVIVNQVLFQSMLPLSPHRNLPLIQAIVATGFYAACQPPQTNATTNIKETLFCLECCPHGGVVISCIDPGTATEGMTGPNVVKNSPSKANTVDLEFFMKTVEEPSSANPYKNCLLLICDTTIMCHLLLPLVNHWEESSSTDRHLTPTYAPTGISIPRWGLSSRDYFTRFVKILVPMVPLPPSS